MLLLSPAGAVGSGVLATITFNAVLFGVSVLGLTNVVLAAPFGIQIGVAEVRDGLVTIRDSVSVIPVPMGILISLIGLSIFGVRIRG